MIVAHGANATKVHQRDSSPDGLSAICWAIYLVRRLNDSAYASVRVLMSGSSESLNAARHIGWVGDGLNRAGRVMVRPHYQDRHRKRAASCRKHERTFRRNTGLCQKSIRQKIIGILRDWSSSVVIKSGEVVPSRWHFPFFYCWPAT